MDVARETIGIIQERNSIASLVASHVIVATSIQENMVV